MKLKLQKEGQSLTGEVHQGFMGAHIVLSDPDGTGIPTLSINLKGTEVSDSGETRYLTWELETPSQRGSVEIQVEPMEEADPPHKRHSSKSKDCIPISETNAEKVLGATQSCSQTLCEILDEMRDVLDTETFEQLATSVGEVLAAIDRSVNVKLYRQHPALAPEELKNMPK